MMISANAASIRIPSQATKTASTSYSSALLSSSFASFQILQHRLASSSSSTTTVRKQHNLALIGPPGSGKGTYGKLLSSRLSNHRLSKQHAIVPLITCSDILEEHIEQKTNVGLAMQDCKKHGRLANDELVGRAVLDYLMDHHHHHFIDDHTQEEKDTEIGYILDGFPRTVPQAIMMDNNDKSSSSLSWPPPLSITYAISIDVPDQICIDKIRGRRVCSQCHHSYNIANVDYDGYYMPPTLPKQPCSDEGYCDRTINWTCRHDDVDEEIVKRRIQDFHKETKDVLKYYEDRGRLIHFRPYRGVDDMDMLEELVLDRIGLL